MRVIVIGMPASGIERSVNWSVKLPSTAWASMLRGSVRSRLLAVDVLGQDPEIVDVALQERGVEVAEQAGGDRRVPLKERGPFVRAGAGVLAADRTPGCRR